MASGDVVGLIDGWTNPGADYAPYSHIDGGSTPAEKIPVFLFDDNSDEHLDFYGFLSGYGNGGLTVRGAFSSPDQTTGNVRWGAAIRRVADDAEDLDASHTYAYNEVTVTTASAAGELSYFTITFTNGSDMDSLADGERFILRIRRNGNDAADTMSGDAELWAGVVVEET